MKLSWSTAIVIVACLGAYVALAIAGKEVPPWMGALMASVGTIVAGVLSPLLQKPELPASERITDPDIHTPGGVQ